MAWNFNEIFNETCNFVEIWLQQKVISCEFGEVFRNIYFVEYLQTAASE